MQDSGGRVGRVWTSIGQFRTWTPVDEMVGKSYVEMLAGSMEAAITTTSQRQENASVDGRVLVSNTAANMISSLHPLDKAKAKAALSKVRSSVLDPAEVERINGVNNAFVARAGKLRVIFKREGDGVVITSVLGPRG